MRSAGPCSIRAGHCFQNDRQVRLTIGPFQKKQVSAQASRPCAEEISRLMKHVDTPQTRCQAGVSRGDITPPVGIYHRMWGAAMHDRATGVHRPLLATLLWLQPSEEDARHAQL